MAMAASAKEGFEETDPLFLMVEEHWIKPCTAQLPRPLHGMCLYLPMFGMFAMLLCVVGLLAWCDTRSKAKAAAAEAGKKKKKS